jgi:isochorismate hydrolase
MQEYFLNFWGENSAMMEQVVANIALRASANRTIFRLLHRSAERAER